MPMSTSLRAMPYSPVTEQDRVTTERANALLASLQAKLGTHIRTSKVELGHAIVEIGRKEMQAFFEQLRNDPELGFDMLLSVTAVDWMDQRDERFEVVYHLLSLSKLHRVRVKIPVPEEKPEVASLSPLWSSAVWLERETWDMYGIRFEGLEDHRRTLLYEEFKGHPLRKDYPVQAKQPRIPLRYPEVRNTAVDMKRPPLVKINRRPPRLSVPNDGSSNRFKKDAS